MAAYTDLGEKGHGVKIALWWGKMAYYWWEIMNRFLKVQSCLCELSLQKKSSLLSGKVPGRQKQITTAKLCQFSLSVD